MTSISANQSKADDDAQILRNDHEKPPSTRVPFTERERLVICHKTSQGVPPRQIAQFLTENGENRRTGKQVSDHIRYQKLNKEKTVNHIPMTGGRKAKNVDGKMAVKIL